MHIDRNASTVIDNGDRVILIDRDIDMSGESGQRLIDRVVDNFIDQMMQTLA